MPESLMISAIDRVYRDPVGNVLVLRGQAHMTEIYFLYSEMGCTVATKLTWVAVHNNPMLLQVDYGSFSAFLSVRDEDCAFVGGRGELYRLVESGDETRPNSLEIRTEEEQAALTRKHKEAANKRKKHRG